LTNGSTVVYVSPNDCDGRKKWKTAIRKSAERGAPISRNFADEFGMGGLLAMPHERSIKSKPHGIAIF
jgi:hypothetical protein